jgi:hypothetical protein
MEFKFSKINGTNRHLNYGDLEKNIIDKLSATCTEAEAIILNKFPVSVTPQADLDLLMLINIPKKHRSWYRVKDGNDKVYIKNQIIAISIIDDFEDEKLFIEGNEVSTENEFINHEENANKIKYGLTNYLADKCNLNRKYITVHPIVWVKNNKTTFEGKDIYIGNNLLYSSIENIIKQNYYFKYAGYIDWHNDDMIFEHQIRTIYEQASRDSEEGFITKKKIDRIQRKLGANQKKTKELIGKKLVEVKGKAGTGKTSDLLSWMLKNSLEGKKAVFLTYNHLLVYDITLQIKSFQNRITTKEKASTTTYTLHKFFFDLSKKLGILLLMSEKRIEELIAILDSRLLEVKKFLNKEKNKGNTSLAKLIMLAQNNRTLEQGVKREAIAFIKKTAFDYTFLPDNSEVNELLQEYREEKREKLSRLESSNIFLEDYHAVLERILVATTDLDNFLKDMDIVNKYELLNNVLNLKEDILEKDNSKKINYKKIRTRLKKTINGKSWNRTVYVDEAQDCHPFEKDILLNIFGSKNCVIANGDKEQLIRYSEVCNWHISKKNKIDFHVYNRGSSSFRMKPAIAALSNHIAKWYGIGLDIEAINTDDHGHIYISNSNSISKEIDQIDRFNNIGIRKGCSSYESVLLLKHAGSGNKGMPKYQDDKNEKSVRINEFNNIIDSKNIKKSNWDLVEKAEEELEEIKFWNSTGNVDKRELAMPQYLSLRSIYYESCRGLEAWSTMLFNLDSFFEDKKDEDEADNFLLENLFDQLNPDERKEMYAATWVLMAVTRCIENCYIHLDNENSSLSHCLKDFASKNNDLVKVI